MIKSVLCCLPRYQLYRKSRMHRKPYVAELDVLLGQEDVVSNHLTGTAVRHWTMSVPDGNISTY